ncbi:MAG: polysulfide reductase NrfD [Herpetosiphonaceae bacterium]|nr:polysulfide reductase NrfD [Herpetosiphonaceae bacterium]
MGITASPNWGGWLVAYFFIGGIAAGAYFIAGLIELIGSERDREMARGAYYLAFPLLVLCSIFLIADLHRPERFWHMLIQSNTFWPMFKYWSPMSVGSWILSAFGAASFVSFVDTLAEDGRLGLGRFGGWARSLRLSPVGKLFAVLEMLAAYGLAAYTGVLLTATNVPFWSNTNLLGALFMASAASTGIAALLLLQHRTASHESLAKLETADSLAMGLELLIMIGFVISLGGLAGRFVTNPYGLVMLVGTGGLGLLLPLLLRLLAKPLGRNPAVVNALLVLIGGLLLRYGILFAGESLTSRVG